jgi:DeoR/GlpR family transcriptional regulator of sugar metabolism
VRLFHTEPSVAERMRMMTSEREAIVATVSASIAANEVLLIGGGATTLHIARRLARDHRSLTVVTHVLDIVAALGSNAGITVICTPGQYDAREALLAGYETVALLRSFAAHRAILGATGITEDGMSNAEDLLGARPAAERDLVADAGRDRPAPPIWRMKGSLKGVSTQPGQSALILTPCLP